ncbi:hypothetical protein [Halopiger goleimassiliensis]|uniref:hypothetical protein n=1 Tax=Halopiger goleimassiliensis TaxID=1293048 RepID=UPI0006780CCC|nr:hypothetical protein [Halopiger goleimassiliensis]
MPTDSDDLELSEAERAALHECQLGIEYVNRAYGSLLAFHHHLGRAMNRMADAESALREAGHERWANELRDDHLPAGAIEDQWSYELVEEFEDGFLADLTGFEAAVRDDLADGTGHVTERRYHRHLRERARGEEE